MLCYCAKAAVAGRPVHCRHLESHIGILVALDCRLGYRRGHGLLFLVYIRSEAEKKAQKA